jgi:hypothetical protein
MRCRYPFAGLTRFAPRVTSARNGAYRIFRSGKDAAVLAPETIAPSNLAFWIG